MPGDDDSDARRNGDQPVTPVLSGCDVFGPAERECAFEFALAISALPFHSPGYQVSRGGGTTIRIPKLETSIFNHTFKPSATSHT